MFRLNDWRSPGVPLTVGFTLLIGIVAATTWLGARLAASNMAVQKSLDIELHLSGVLSDLQDAETGQRGYLLTGDEAYLSPYAAAVERLPRELAELRTLIADNPELVTHASGLKEVVAEKLDELAATVELRRAGSIRESLGRVAEGRGKRMMDRARTTVQDMRAVAGRLLLERQALAEQQTRRVQFAIILAFLTLMGVAALTLVKTRRQTLDLLAAHDDLKGATDKLIQEALQREHLEAQVRQSQKMEAMGQLTGGLAHDFNNMLAVIISSLNLLKRRLDRGETKVTQFIDGAMHAAERAATLTHRLLAFSRQQPLSPEPIDANKFVGGMSDLLRRTLGQEIRLETVLAGGLWRTHADASQLESAVLNLAVNARDAMPDGGRLTIETGNAHLDDAYAAAHVGVPAGQYVLVAVTDTGTGMPPEVAAKAFDPFFTTKGVGKGTGLGLSQVHGFVRQSNGHVKIYTEPGSGTTVKLYLPRFVGAQEPSEKTKAPDKPLQVGQASEIVLVVEDEDQVRHLSVEALKELGYTVLDAPGAAAALKILDERPDITLLFTDIVMPDINGRKLADEAVRRKPGLKVLYTTGFTSNAIIHNGVLDAGVHLITKPFTLEQLAAKTREVLAG